MCWLSNICLVRGSREVQSFCGAFHTSSVRLLAPDCSGAKKRFLLSASAVEDRAQAGHRCSQASDWTGASWLMAPVVGRDEEQASS
jgi:hypothetical protein